MTATKVHAIVLLQRFLAKWNPVRMKKSCPLAGNLSAGLETLEVSPFEIQRCPHPNPCMLKTVRTSAANQIGVQAGSGWVATHPEPDGRDRKTLGRKRRGRAWSVRPQLLS